MPIELSDAEIETVRDLLKDWGWEYGLLSDRAKLIALAKRLKMDEVAVDRLRYD